MVKGVHWWKHWGGALTTRTWPGLPDVEREFFVWLETPTAIRSIDKVTSRPIIGGPIPPKFRPVVMASKGAGTAWRLANH